MSLTSCDSRSGGKFLGEWKSQRTTLTITQSGNNFIIAFNPHIGLGTTATATLKEDRLDVLAGGLQFSAIVDDSGNKLITGFGEFTRMK